mgnify:CR=1 FL=1|tara:strand:+ start:56 stop:652 length:597 start_codon:yes stop_codon:yes gene_type:complete
MKKLSTYLFLILLSFSIPSYGDDIKEFEIEGISIGESLLEYLSKEQIISEIEVNKPTYNYLNEDFGEVYLFESSDKYYALSFMVKPKDKYFNIYSIRGMIDYDNKIEKCFTKKKEIVKEFSLIFSNATQREETLEFNWDPTGESITYITYFDFENGDFAKVSCSKFKKSLKIENNWIDGLAIQIGKKKILEWFDNPIN